MAKAAAAWEEGRADRMEAAMAEVSGCLKQHAVARHALAAGRDVLQAWLARARHAATTSVFGTVDDGWEVLTG